MTIQRFIQERGIKVIFHFTKLRNLGSILAHGLVTRNRLLDKQHCNDGYRMDRTDAVCASIGFPNYKMFWSLRKQNPTEEWIILAISPLALIELRCAFCQENAASNNVSGLSIAQRSTLEALQRMYGDFGEKERKDLPIPDDYPTHPQAEILFLDGVPLRYVGAILVQNEAMKQKIEKSYPRNMMKVVAKSDYFGPRKDYAHWQVIA